MNRTIKEATVNRYHYDSHDQLRAHLVDFVTAYNSPVVLRSLKASPLTNTSAAPGQKSPADSLSIRSKNAGTKHLGLSVARSRSAIWSPVKNGQAVDQDGSSASSCAVLSKYW